MITEEKRRFHTVFERFGLPNVLYQMLGNATVRSVTHNKATNALEIELAFRAMIDERYVRLFKDALMKDYPFAVCEICCVYTLAETDPHQRVALYWHNLLSGIFEAHPFAWGVLSKAPWQLCDGKLVIGVASGAFATALKMKGIDRWIQNKLARCIGLSVDPVFKENEMSDHEKGLYLAELKKRESALSAEVASHYGAANENNEKKTAAQPRYAANAFPKRRGGGRGEMAINPALAGVKTKLRENLETGDDILIEGVIVSFDQRETKSGKLLTTFDMTDGTDSVTVKFFSSPEKYTDEFKALIQKGSSLKLLGRVQFDEFSKELNVMAKECAPSDFCLSNRKDEAGKKRVELHLHTNMSQMDATNTAADYVRLAAEWGHKAVAITDHGVVQAFPEAMTAAKQYGVKVLYGVEAYLADDLGAVIKSPGEKTLDDDFVVFDIETTGLKKETCEIIEIGAVRVSGGQITETFSALINPNVLLPSKIVELTHITDDMLIGQPTIDAVLPRFLAFARDAVLVAHNAAFDIGFVRQNALRLGLRLPQPVLGTVELTRTLFPDLPNHKLGTLVKHFGVSLENHHRACDDAAATAEIFLRCAALLREKGVRTLKEINALAGAAMDKKKLRHYHAIILVRNSVGLRNLYELVSNAHLLHFYKRPRILKSDYLRLKEGLIIGTACEAGEFYKAVRDKMPEEYIAELAEFYDYFEIQPLANNAYLVREGIVPDRDGLIAVNQRIVALGEQYNKPVVATCDVHFMNPEDEVFRRILLAGSGFKDADEPTPLYFRTTEEMLREFSYLGAAKAEEVVITNTNRIADQIDVIKPIPDETFPPKIEGAEERLTEITMARAREIYGDPLPPLVADRLERELTSIIKNGFSVLYIIAQKLVWKSVEDGYLVGSRGSVGSSFVATMAGITEVNPLPPHYICPACQYSDFDSDTVKAFAGASGCDMPEGVCPSCGAALLKDGHDIPFETFLGFDGDKEPDIDLNFSGEYQAKAHAYTEELFGTGFVFKAGTIGTLAEKTAFGYVKKYLDERQLTYRNAEMNRLVLGCTGVKKTTGQHPGGLMIVPSDQSIYRFCPIQRPANDMRSDVTTTHFDYHSISGRLLKLDLLGHDVPTIIRMLHDFTGVDPRTVDLGDSAVLSLFTSPAALGVSPEAINCKTGTLGLPEFGTGFVRQMLMDTRPNSFAELVRISGLSHGTDVWFNNAQALIQEGTATLKEVIPTRDDIMVYLIHRGVEKKASFKIMENVRKGKGLTEEEAALMLAAGVPEWYIESCRRIKYMFPKGHAVAYVMMTVRIGYFKIYHPLAFYAASFSVKADAFDYEKMCKGKDTVRQEIRRIAAVGKEASAKEKDSLTMLELVLELYERGLKFAPLDLYTAEAMKFQVMGDAILPPLCAIQGMGENAARSIVAARKDGEFISVQDFRERTKISKTVIEILKANRILDGVPETNQLSLF